MKRRRKEKKQRNEGRRKEKNANDKFFKTSQNLKILFPPDMGSNTKYLYFIAFQYIF